jgi:acyl-CoA thioesterase-1
VPSRKYCVMPVPFKPALVLIAALSAMLSVPADRAAAESVRLAILGDSLAAGFGLPVEDGFTAQLERRLRAQGLDVTVLNAGVSGDTSAGGRARLDWTLADKPDFVVVELGSNDTLRGLDPERTFDNLDAIVGELRGRGMGVLIAGMLAPLNLGPEYGGAFNEIFPRVAKKHGVMLYPFFLDGVALDPALNQGDLIHPNRAGVAVIVERIEPFVRRLIDGAAPGN